MDVDTDLFLLDDVEAFVQHARRIAEGSRRELAILSASLDRQLYDREEFAGAVSRLVREDRNARLRILVKDSRPLVEHGHRLLELSRRLSSKVEIRTLATDAPDAERAFIIGDRERLLFQHEEGVYHGFANYRAGPEITPLLDSFNELWERHSELSPDLRRLHL